MLSSNFCGFYRADRYSLNLIAYIKLFIESLPIRRYLLISNFGRHCPSLFYKGTLEDIDINVKIKQKTNRIGHCRLNQSTFKCSFDLLHVAARQVIRNNLKKSFLISSSRTWGVEISHIKFSQKFQFLFILYQEKRTKSTLQIYLEN